MLEALRYKRRLAVVLAGCCFITGVLFPNGVWAAGEKSTSVSMKTVEAPQTLAEVGADPSVGAGPVVDSIGHAASGTVFTSVYGLKSTLPPPVLNPLPPITKDDSVVVSGQAVDGATVTIAYSINGEYYWSMETTAAVGEDGIPRFAARIDTRADGLYSFTATAVLNGEQSTDSEPVTVLVDQTSPGEVEGLMWEVIAPSIIQLSWEAPLMRNSEGEYVPDPAIAKYIVYDRERDKTIDTIEMNLIVDGLEQSKLYEITVSSVDLAGNKSDGRTITAAASPPGEAKLADVNIYGGDPYAHIAMSRDGSTIAVVDKGQEAEAARQQTAPMPMISASPSPSAGHLYAIDTSTRAKETVSVTKDGLEPKGQVKKPVLSGDGSIVAFASDAANLTAAPVPNRGTYIYVYNRAAKTMELISGLNGSAADPGISGDGSRIVYTEGGRIYLYDRADQTRRLVSRTIGGQPENGGSYGPAISGDGNVVAFQSSSSNLDVENGGPIPDSGTSIFIYDVTKGAIVRQFSFQPYVSSLNLNGDGHYLAYTGATGAEWGKPYVIDLANGTETDLNAGRDPALYQNKDYYDLSISEDGQTVLASVSDFNPAIVGLSDYGERFDLQTHQVSVVGNPAMNAYGFTMDGAANRMAYVRNQAIYSYCDADCGQPEPGDALESVKWSVPGTSRIGDEIKLGTTLTVQANGRPGESVQAVVAYRLRDAVDPAIMTSRETTIELPEQGEGVYRGGFTIEPGVTEVTSITAKLTNGSFTKRATGLPVKAAGRLAIDLDTADADRLEGARFTVIESGASRGTFAASRGTKHYEYDLAAGDDLTVRLYHDEADLLLAEQSDIDVAGGVTTSVRMTPVFAARLHVGVYNDDGPLDGVHVHFYDSNGVELADVATNAEGKALLPSEHTAGEKLTVSVDVPPVYRIEEPRSVTLQLGLNDLTFALKDLNDQVYGALVAFSKEVGRGAYAVPVMGSDAEIRVSAEPGLSLKAKVQYERWNGDGEEAAVWTVELIESRSGTYTGTFTIEEGTSRLERLSVIAGDTLLARKYPIDQNVAGRLKLTLDVPDGNWTDAFVDANLVVGYYSSTDYSKSFIEGLPLNSKSRSYTIDVPFDQISYTVTLNSRNYAIIGQQSLAVAPEYGRTKDVALKPKFRVLVTGNVTDEDGRPLVGRYTVTDADNQVVTSGWMYDSAATIMSFIETLPEAVFHLNVFPNDPLYNTKVVDLQLGATTVELPPVVLKRKPINGLSGHVFGTDGKPTTSGVVTATVTQGDASRTFSAAVGPTGAYTLQLPAGPATVRATGYNGRGVMSPAVKIDVPEQGGTTADFRLLDYGRIEFKLYTKEPGGDWQGPVDFDWTTAYHWGLSSSHTITPVGTDFQVYAVSGDTVRICVSGAEANMPYTCKEGVMGDENRCSIEMRLENSKAEAQFALEKPDGTRLKSAKIDLYMSDGGYISTYAITPQDTFTLPIGRPDQYRMVVTGENGLTATVDFKATAGTVHDLGVIRLQGPGKFNGQRGTGIQTASDWATPGGRIAARISYGNVGQPAGRAANARLQIELPEGTDFASGTLILNGKATSGELNGRTLEVPLGDIPYGTGGSLQLQLTVGNSPASPFVALPAVIRYSDGATERQESIGQAVVQLLPVTIRVPERVRQRSIALSGIAPAGAEVTVYDGTETIGRATASPAGMWQLSGELVVSEVERHKLRTETTIDGRTVPGQSAVVRFDPNDPGLEQVSMRQTDGRLQTFDTVGGTAIFPYVVVPNNPFVFQLKFRDPARISHVKVYVGDSWSEALPQEDGSFAATVPFTENLGAVSVTYDVQPKPWDPATDLHEPASEDALREELHPMLRGYTIQSVEQAGGSGQSVGGTATIRAKLNEDIGATVKYSIDRVPNYQPSGQDLKRASQTGLPVYGMQVAHSIGSTDATITLTAYLPESSLRKGDELASALELMGRATDMTLASGMAGSGPPVAALGAETGALVKATLSLTLDLLKGKLGQELFNMFDRYWTLKGFVEESELFDRVNKDLVWAQSLCDPQLIKYYSDWAEEIGQDIMFHEAIKWALLVGGVVLGPETFGLATLGLWGLQYAIGKALDWVVENELQQLEDALSRVHCPKKPPVRPIADPKFIWDPSGYVYEGMRGNRLEDVTATALEWNAEAGEWQAWDADWYGQENPQQTDPLGRYGWDVPQGKWKVKYEKPGYETTYSSELKVPPPELDVNVPLVSYAAPELREVIAAPSGGSLAVTFTKPVDMAFVGSGAIEVHDAGGTAVDGAIKAADPENDLGGRTLAQQVTFMPQTPLTVGETYEVKLDGRIVSYAGVPLGSDVVRKVTIEGADTTPPGEVTALTGGFSADSATLTWTAPADSDFAATRIWWKESGESDYHGPIEQEKSRKWATIEQLDPNRSYTFRVTTVDASGNESNGVIWSRTASPETEDVTPPASVRNVTVDAVGPDRITVTWTDPTASDLRWIVLGVRMAASPEAGRTVGLEPGVQTYTVTGLEPQTKYEVTIVARDADGNESAATGITTVTKVRDGGTGTGSGTGTDTGAGTGTNAGSGTTNPGKGDDGSGSKGPETSGQWTIDADGGKFSAFSGQLQLQLPKGAVDAGTKLTFEKQSLVSAGMAGYTAYSPSFTLRIANGTLREPAKLTIQYDASAALGNEERRLGLYRKNDSGLDGWTYVGGVVRTGARELTATITGLGEYAVMLYDHPFPDVNGHWGRTAVDTLVSRHIVDGVTNDRFEPDRPVTRAEAAKLLLQLLKQVDFPGFAESANRTGAVSFADVSPDAWYASVIAEAAQLGLLEGADGKVRPNDSVTREELTALLVRFRGLLEHADGAVDIGAVLDRFADAGSISDWARAAFAEAVSLGWIEGMNDGTAAPREGATRAQAAALLVRVLDGFGAIEMK